MRTEVALTSWVASSLGNNYATPSLLDAIGSPLALNILEQASMALIAICALQLRGLPLVDTEALKRVPLQIIAMGVCNAITARLFMVSLHHLPLSLCHTIRAASPCCAAIIGMAGGRRFSARQLTSLPIMVAGFALAVSAEPSFSLVGVAAAVGSLIALSALQHLSRSLLDSGSTEMQVQLLQCSLCFVMLFPWLKHSESRSLRVMLTSSRRFRLLTLVNGLSDYVENVAATVSCGLFEPLTFSVLDTLRRLVVILVCGFVARGNRAGPANVAGTLLVLSGAVLYSCGPSQQITDLAALRTRPQAHSQDNVHAHGTRAGSRALLFASACPHRSHRVAQNR